MKLIPPCSSQKLTQKRKTNAKKGERGRQKNIQLHSTAIIAPFEVLRKETTHCKILSLHNSLTVILLTQFTLFFTPLTLATTHSARGSR